MSRQMPASRFFLISCLLLLVVAWSGAPRIAWAQAEEATTETDLTAATDVEVTDDPEDPEPNERIEEITVTTNRREESIQDVAVSVTALSGKFIEEAGLTDFASMQKFTPNLSILPQTDSRSTSIRIRGIGSVGSNAGIDPSVATFIDGVYQGRAGMSIADLLDIDRIEILRGPQGTLYGKNTAAGAINVYTKKPIYDFTADLEFLVGSYSNYEGRWALNAPILDDVLATRFSGYYVTRDGFDTNAFDGSEVNGSDKWGLRSRTLWDVTDELEILITGDYAQQDDSCCVSDIIQYGAPLPGGLSEILPSAREVEAFQLGEGWIDPLPVEDPEDRLVSADIAPRNEVSVGGVSIEANYDWNDFNIMSLTAYRNYQNDSTFDGDFSLLNSTQWATEVGLDQVSTELRLVSPADDLIEYVAGFYFYYMDMETDDTLSWTPEYIAATAFSNLDPSRTEFQYNDGSNSHNTLNVAAYGETNFGVSEYFNWTQRFELTGGARVGYERKRREGLQVSQGPLCALNNDDTPTNPGGFDCLPEEISGPYFLETPLSGPPQVQNQERSVTDISGRVILKYWPTDDVMIYGSFASGVKSGGFNQLRTNNASENASNTEFDDEHSKSYEAGIKTSWFERMVTFNLTGFYTNYDDFQAQVFDGFGIRVINAGEFISYGFESELTIVPVPEWITSFSVGFNKTKYESFDRGPCTGLGSRVTLAGGSYPGCKVVFGEGIQQDLAGRPLDNAPEWTIALFSAYENAIPFRIPLIQEANWFVQTDYQYLSDRFLNASLDPVLDAPHVNLLGFRAGFRHPEASWEAAVWVKNTLDESFYVAGFDVPTMGGQAVALGPPRTVGATFRVKF